MYASKEKWHKIKEYKYHKTARITIMIFLKVVICIVWMI